MDIIGFLVVLLFVAAFIGLSVAAHIKLKRRAEERKKEMDREERAALERIREKYRDVKVARQTPSTPVYNDLSEVVRAEPLRKASGTYTPLDTWPARTEPAPTAGSSVLDTAAGVFLGNAASKLVFGDDDRVAVERAISSDPDPTPAQVEEAREAVRSLFGDGMSTTVDVDDQKPSMTFDTFVDDKPAASVTFDTFDTSTSDQSSSYDSGSTFESSSSYDSYDGGYDSGGGSDSGGSSGFD